MLCQERREISLNVLLVNYHDVTSRIFQQRILCQTGMKSPLKWHNQSGMALTSKISEFYGATWGHQE